MSHPDDQQKQHGGFRPGAGRPPRETPAVEPTQKIDPNQPKQHGGKRPRSGRHPRSEVVPATSWLPTSQAQVDMWKLLGGGSWLRSVLDKEILKKK